MLIIHGKIKRKKSVRRRKVSWLRNLFDFRLAVEISSSRVTVFQPPIGVKPKEEDVINIIMIKKICVNNYCH